MANTRNQTRPRHPGPARRTGARPGDHGARRADLRDHQLRLQEHRPRGEPLRPEGVRQHLLPADEPDQRRAGEAPGRAGRRRRRRWPSPAGRRPSPRRSSPSPTRGRTSSPSTSLYGGTWTLFTQTLQEARHRGAVLRPGPSRSRSTSWSTRTRGCVYLETRRQPEERRAGLPQARRHRPQARPAGDRRQHRH